MPVQPCTRSFRQGTSYSAKFSWISTFGVDQPKWSAAHSATGPIEQCGASRMSLRLGRSAAIFLPIRRPAAVGQVRLHDVAGSQRRQSLEFLQHVEPLAGGDGNGSGPFHLRQIVQAPGRHRLLVPGGTIRHQPRAISIAHAARQPAVDLDHQLDLVADRCRGPRRRSAPAFAISSGVISFQAVPNGSNFIAR